MPPDIEAIVDDLAALKRDLATLMSHLKTDALNGASEAAQSAVGRIGEQAESIYESLAAQGKRSGKAIGRQVEERTDQLGVLEALLVADSANRKFMPTLSPIIDGWFSSNFGYRIDPFTGLQSFHEGIDFPADNGTPVIAAASGKVIESGYQPQYGKIVVIDHGNGLVSRYAHASEVYVNEGDLVVRGQRVASVGSTGRSTGPHLHFEVRLNGVPQNPARFLHSPS